MNSSASKFKRFGGHGIFLLSIPVGSFGLGTWQVQRREWKLNLIEELQQKTNLPPVPFPDHVEELQDLEYKKVLISGEFDHTKELYLGPRPLLMADSSVNTGGLGVSSPSGYNVITPFTLSGRNVTILVNRGWVPRNYLKTPFVTEGKVKGTVEMTAVVRRGESRAPFMPENSPHSRSFFYRDVARMADATGSSPVLVDAVETFEGGPVGSQTRITLRNEHLSYILTWYSLSLATGVLWYRRFVKNMPLM